MPGQIVSVVHQHDVAGADPAQHARGDSRRVDRARVAAVQRPRHHREPLRVRGDHERRALHAERRAVERRRAVRRDRRDRALAALDLRDLLARAREALPARVAATSGSRARDPPRPRGARSPGAPRASGRSRRRSRARRGARARRARPASPRGRGRRRRSSATRRPLARAVPHGRIEHARARPRDAVREQREEHRGQRRSSSADAPNAATAPAVVAAYASSSARARESIAGSDHLLGVRPRPRARSRRS